MEESNPAGREKELLASALSGHPESFEALVNLYERRIYQIAYRIVENAQDAEDVLQETFLKAFANLHRFRGESSFYTWTVQIAVNAALQRVNKRRKRPTVSLDNDGDEEEKFFSPREIVVWEENPERLYAKKEAQVILDQAIAELPVIYRTVFLLKDVENLPMDAIARSLGISIPAAKSRLIRARLELRESLGRHFRKKGAPVYTGEHQPH
jgi:RNA polymerase sigma-70 factor (ECF subfamily)